MADIGFLRGLFAGLPTETRRIFAVFIEYAFSNLRVGLPGHQKPAENMAWVQLNGTTSATANSEVSIVHGLAEAPRVLFPVVGLTSSGGSLVNLTVTRPADSKRVYLSSPSTAASFVVFVESRG